MAKRKKSRPSKAKLYKQKAEFIRPYVNFKVPAKPSKATKNKVDRYARAIRENLKFSHAVKVPKKQFKKVQADLNPNFTKATGLIKKTDYKVLFVPNNKQGARPKYVKKFKRYGLEEKVGRRRVVSFVVSFDDLDALVGETNAYIDRLVRPYPRKAKFRLFNPQDWRDRISYDKKSAFKAVEAFMNAYPGSGLENQNYSGLWGFVVEL